MDYTLETTRDAVLYLSSDAIPPGYTYDMRVTVVSRWNLTSMKDFQIQKLDYTTPTVKIRNFEGTVSIMYRQNSVLLQIEVEQSQCQYTEPSVTCDWTCEAEAYPEPD
jgi:hypothetical protein